MGPVTVRDAHPRDAAGIASVWAAAVPYLVRSDARATRDLEQDAELGRCRWVAELDGRVAGVSAARPDGETGSRIGVEVHPDLGSRGVGTALLGAALLAFPDVEVVTAVCNADPIAMSFAVRHNFVPEAEHQVARAVPADVAPPGPVPAGLHELRLDQVDLGALLSTYNLTADDDPSGLSEHYDEATFHADWWDGPDNAPDFSWALVEETGDVPQVVAFSSVQVDRPRRRAWTAMTGTHPDHRGRGLATWVKRRAMLSLAEAKVREAWTANDATNAPMLAVNRALGYQPAARSIRVVRRLRP